MGKKGASFLLTLVGILIIVIIQVRINIDEDKENRVKEFIIKNVSEAAKKCVRDGKCTDKSVTVYELIEKEYIDKDIQEEVLTYQIMPINTETFDVVVKN